MTLRSSPWVGLRLWDVRWHNPWLVDDSLAHILKQSVVSRSYTPVVLELELRQSNADALLWSV